MPSLSLPISLRGNTHAHTRSSPSFLPLQQILIYCCLAPRQLSFPDNRRIFRSMTLYEDRTGRAGFSLPLLLSDDGDVRWQADVARLARVAWNEKKEEEENHESGREGEAEREKEKCKKWVGEEEEAKLERREGGGREKDESEEISHVLKKKWYQALDGWLYGMPVAACCGGNFNACSTFGALLFLP